VPFFGIAVRNLGRRPVRSSLTALGIALAVSSFIALVGMSRGLERAWITTLLERGTHVLAVRKGAVELLTGSVDAHLEDGLRRVDGVQAVSGELVDLLSLDTGQTVIVVGWPAGSFLWRPLRLVDGALPDPAQPAGILAGQTIAAGLGKQPGDVVRIRGRAFTIAGTFRQAGAMGNSAMILQLPAMQDLVGRPGQVTEFNLRLARPDEPAERRVVQARLAEAFRDLTFTETRDVADNNDILRLVRAMAWSVSIIALVIALVMVLNTLLMSVAERTREIGILSAVGWQPGRILAMILTEGLVLAATGSAAGAAVGIAGLAWLARQPQVRGFLEPHATPQLVAEVVGAAVALGIIGSLYPAWRAVRLNPVDALRYE
jgi:putative ABC transport system permease protein